jgi:hypothetical protein
MSVVAPAPTGNPITDFNALRTFFNDAPSGSIIELPPGATYEVWAGAVFLKPRQILLGNLSTIRRAAEVVTTTTAGITAATPSMTVPVADASQFLVGQYVAINGARTGSGNTMILWGDARVSAINGNTLTLAVSQPPLDLGTGGYAPGASWQAGVTVMTKGTLIDGARFMDNTSSWTLERLVVDGNRLNNGTLNRWEYCAEFKQFGRSCELNGIEIYDACGEGLLIWGENPRVDGFRATNLNGNAIHFNDTCNDAFVNNVAVDTCNLQAATMGHANGAIIASSNIFRTQIHQFRVINGRLAGVAAWDTTDNSFAKITKGYIENCWQGLTNISGQTIEGIEISDVEVRNCGMSQLGVYKTSTGQANVWAKKWRLHNLKFYDSLVYLQGLMDSDVQLDVYHSNSGTLTSTNAAAGFPDNYTAAGGLVINALCMVGSTQRTRYQIRAEDGGSKAGKYCVSIGPGAGGPNIANVYEVSAKGNQSGVQLSGVHIRCNATLQAEAWASGSTGVFINLSAHAVDAAFAAGYEKPRENDFFCDAFLDTATASNTFCIKTNVPNSSGVAGWTTVRGRARINNVTTPQCYGVSAQGTPSKLRWQDLEVIGPASNFLPLQMSAADAAAGCRVFHVRSFPAPAALGANWAAEDPGLQALPA